MRSELAGGARGFEVFVSEMRVNPAAFVNLSSENVGILMECGVPVYEANLEVCVDRLLQRA